jgi:hypothetical protein
MFLKERLFPPLNKGGQTFVLPVPVAGTHIPRIIHQTFRHRELPAELQANVDHIKALNPAWQHRLYDDAAIEAFIESSYGMPVLRAYQRISPKYGAAKADLFRYLLLYQTGGVYLDIKSTLHRPLDDVLRADDRYVLSRWRNGEGEEHAGWGCAPELKHLPGGEFQQWHIVAAAGHPFLRAVIEHVLTNIGRYNPWLHGTGSSGVFRVTGPVAYTLAIAPLLGQHPHRLTSDQQLGFEYTLFKTVSHRPLFGTHYAKQTESVIQQHGVAAISAWIYDWLKRSKRHLLRRLSGKGRRPVATV